MFCASCGIENPDSAKFCSSCGKSPNGGDANVDLAATANVLASKMRSRVEKQGLMLITAIAYFVGFWSVLALVLGGLGLLGTLGMGSMMGGLGMRSGGGNSAGMAFALMFVQILGTFGLASAYGLFKKQEWARNSTIVIAIIWAVIYVISLLNTKAGGAALSLQAAAYIGIALYLRMPAIKEYFSQE